MTTHSLGHLWSLPADSATRVDSDLRSDAKSTALLNDAVVLRRCALYRKAFRNAAVSYPAELLGSDAVANWIRRQGVTVDVTTAAELDHAVLVDIPTSRIVMHLLDDTAAPIRHAVNAEVGRFVVSSSQQIAILASTAHRVQRVVVDVTRGNANALASQVLAHRQLDFIGLHCRLGDADDAISTARLGPMVAEMSRIRREHAILPTRISLAEMDLGEWCPEPRGLRRVADNIGEVISDACAQYRYPLPALTLSPGRAALLPT